MTVFVDTSALYAVIDRDDEHHSAAKDVWVALLREPATLLTTNYVLVETTALLQRCFGVPAARRFHEDVVPVFQVDWVTAEGHRAGMEAMLAANRKRLTLVDCVSFQTMRRLGVRAVFCFDEHFVEQGFQTRP